MDFKQIRQDIMVIVNTIESLTINSRELSIAKTSAQNAMMWCGTYLKVSKTGDNPYAENDGKRKSVEDIKPLFDATEHIFVKQGANHIETVDMIREEVAKVTDNIFNFLKDPNSINSLELEEEEEMLVFQAIFNCHTRLTESRMWLGMELGRIRDEEKS